MKEDPLSTSIRVLTKYFNQNNIDYVFVGGISVIILGRVRMTMDLDVILDHTSLNISDFVSYLQDNGFSATEDDFTGFEEQIHTNVFLKDGMFRIDIKGIYSDEDQRAIDMAIDSVYNDIPLKINHPVNIIAYKLYFGSEQDFEDAMAVFIRNEEMIDMGDIRDYTKKLGVENKLDEMISEIKQLR